MADGFTTAGLRTPFQQLGSPVENFLRLWTRQRSAQEDRTLAAATTDAQIKARQALQAQGIMADAMQPLIELGVAKLGYTMQQKQKLNNLQDYIRTVNADDELSPAEKQAFIRNATAQAHDVALPSYMLQEPPPGLPEMFDNKQIMQLPGSPNTYVVRQPDGKITFEQIDAEATQNLPYRMETVFGPAVSGGPSMTQRPVGVLTKEEGEFLLKEVGMSDDMKILKRAMWPINQVRKMQGLPTVDLPDAQKAVTGDQGKGRQQQQQAEAPDFDKAMRELDRLSRKQQAGNLTDKDIESIRKLEEQLGAPSGVQAPQQPQQPPQPPQRPATPPAGAPPAAAAARPESQGIFDSLREIFAGPEGGTGEPSFRPPEGLRGLGSLRETPQRRQFEAEKDFPALADLTNLAHILSRSRTDEQVKQELKRRFPKLTDEQIERIIRESKNKPDEQSEARAEGILDVLFNPENYGLSFSSNPFQGLGQTE